MRAKKPSASTLQRATPLPRGSACLQCRTRRVKCDGGLPCKACVRHTKFHGHDECECVYSPPPLPRSAVRKRTAAAAEPDELPTKSTGSAQGDEDTEKPAVGLQDEVRLEALELNMADLERKITANLLTAQDSALPLSPPLCQGLSYPSPAPSLDDAPTPPLSYSPPDSNLSYTSSFDAPLFLPSALPFFAYPTQLYVPPIPMEAPRHQKETYNDVSQWAFNAAAPYSTYDYPSVAPHDVGGEPRIVGWEQSCGVQNDWQPGVDVGSFDEPDSGTGWIDWNV